MNNELTELVGVLRQAADGTKLDIETVRQIRWQTSDELVDRVASESWLRLKNFVDDQDLRSRDASYNEQMKSEIRWRAEELYQMGLGHDPHNRRKKSCDRRSAPQ